MQIHLVAVGNRMPTWVTEGFQDYVKRLPRECELVLREIAPGKRGKNADLARIREEEGERVMASLSRDDYVIALEVGGKLWDTVQLSNQVKDWMQEGRRIALLVGGPEGLSDACRARANQLWSLSSLTLPHPIVRIIVAEQIYRAWSLLNNHPYHR
ncbi:MAG: 23S rRNA (pseudouridine(1915)-N(3))-methyltransferase RlmH [Methylococcaceae bacterium]|jgi:23S rRNA (pseudouridine1915-N3)-methyltransferase|nr:23S rRNA (pseudouridine(1915)-N(3))-methyltransferase RlmH [Methylococcaceae bacterium]